MATMDYAEVVSPPRPAEGHAYQAVDLPGTTATGPGLRSSCKTCAASKLKCSKERPRCARCVKRGSDCTYALLKRAGRKPGQAQTSSRPRRRAPSSTGTEPSPPSGVTGTSTGTSSDDMLRDLFRTPWDMALDMTFDATMAEDSSNLYCGDILDDRHSLSTFSANDFFKHSLDDEQRHANPNDDLHSMLDVPPLVSHASMEPETSQAASMSHDDSQLLRTSRLDGGSCSCLAHVLSLLKRYSASPDCVLESDSTQSIFEQNETAIELLGGLMDCHCFQDGYLVVMMVLVIFKMLGRYAAVAQRPKTSLPGEDHIPSSSDASMTADSSAIAEKQLKKPATVRGFRLDGEDAERRTAQLILGELHRVRQLMKKFSSRLKLLMEKMHDADRAGATSKDLCANATLPTSTLVYKQLEADLAREWRALSARVIDRLKKL